MVKVPFYALLHEPGVALGAIGFGVVSYIYFSYTSYSRMLVSVILAHWSVVWFFVLFGMHFKKPGIMCKRGDGSMPVWAVVFWWPWMIIHFSYIHFFRIVKRPSFPVISEIHEGFFLGGFPAFVRFDSVLHCPTPLVSKSGGTIVQAPFCSVLDMTCELPQMHAWNNFMCIPTWDGTAPSLQQLDVAIDWIISQREAGHGVLVHCCYGVGRSAMVLAAALVKCGVCHSLQEAEQLLISKRSLVYLTPFHWDTLTKWANISGIPIKPCSSPSSPSLVPPINTTPQVGEPSGPPPESGVAVEMHQM
ncbi:Dual specificity phosphatase [Pelomyxa schiedti]|nr:Dual specificity phosphatase [Pelomyxa schiedti]